MNAWMLLGFGARDESAARRLGLCDLGWCVLPQSTTWGGVVLVGLLGGIGFTMAIFIATQAFESAVLLQAAKAGVLLGSIIGGLAGLSLGWLVYLRVDCTRD